MFLVHLQSDWTLVRAEIAKIANEIVSFKLNILFEYLISILNIRFLNIEYYIV